MQVALSAAPEEGRCVCVCVGGGGAMQGEWEGGRGRQAGRRDGEQWMESPQSVPVAQLDSPVRKGGEEGRWAERGGGIG